MATINSQTPGIHAIYAVDLLKGDGIPIPARPGGIAAACLIAVVPLLFGLGLASFYTDSRVIISIEKQQLHRLEAAIENMSPALSMKESLEREKTKAAGLLSDIKTALGGYAQWSQTLTELVENLSDTLVLTRLEARQDTVRRKVPAPDNPAITVDVSVPVRTLKISVCGRQAGTALEAVQAFQENLRSAPVLGPLLDTITVSQDTVVMDGREAVLYELECVLRTGPNIQNN